MWTFGEVARFDRHRRHPPGTHTQGKAVIQRIVCLLLLVFPLNVSAKDCVRPPTGLVPLTERARNPLVSDVVAEVVPRDALGVPSAGGLIGVASMGMSNTAMEWRTFAQGGAPPTVRLVNGAVGGADLFAWLSARGEAWKRRGPWEEFAQALARAGVAPLQLQVVWLKNTIASGRSPAELLVEDGYPVLVEEALRGVLLTLAARYPSVRVVYLSSRIYAGWSGPRGINSEPMAYWSGLAVDRLITRQADGDPLVSPPLVPVLAWGPYLWADGLMPRAEDGLTWACGDFAKDGVHPSASGRAKAAALLRTFFETEPWWR